MLLAVFTAAAHTTILLALRRWRLFTWLAAGIALAALLYAPMAGSLVAYYRAHPEDTGYPLLSMTFLRALAPVIPVLLAAAAVMLPVLIGFARREPVAAAVLLAPVAFNVLVPLVRGQGVYPRSFIYLLALGYLLLVEIGDRWLPRRERLVWLGVGVMTAASMAMLAPYYRMPKQGFRLALAYIEQRSAPADRRVGLGLAGKAERVYDPAFLLVEDMAELRALTSTDARPLWIVTTFHQQLRSAAPDMFQWLGTETTRQAEFRGVIGDGTVYVHYWPRGRYP
jgi:hypothetical protein